MLFCNFIQPIISLVFWSIVFIVKYRNIPWNFYIALLTLFRQDFVSPLFRQSYHLNHFPLAFEKLLCNQLKLFCKFYQMDIST